MLLNECSCVCVWVCFRADCRRTLCDQKQQSINAAARRTSPTTGNFYLKQNFCFDKDNRLLHFCTHTKKRRLYMSLYMYNGCQTQYLMNNIMHAYSWYATFFFSCCRNNFASDYVINEHGLFFYFCIFCVCVCVFMFKCLLFFYFIFLEH